MVSTLPNNNPTFLRLLELAKQGDVCAQINLSMAYHFGRFGIKDPAQAKKWARRAAEQEDARAQCFLGELLADEGDLTRAREWLFASANQGYLRAVHKIAELLVDEATKNRQNREERPWF